MSNERAKHWSLRLAVSFLIAFLALLVFKKSFAAYLAVSAPHSAAAWLSSPAIQLALANDAITAGAQQLTADQKQQIRNWIVDALHTETLDARGLEIMGMLTATTPDAKSADQILSLAAGRSLRRSIAVYWTAHKKHAERNYNAALQYIDALLRSRTQSMPLVIPMLASMTESVDARAPLESLLAQHPPWRASFFMHLRGHIRNARAPLELLLALKATTEPPTSQEIGSYLRLLLEQKLYRLSYYSWLQLLSDAELRQAGLLFNGDFTFVPSGLPYDWMIKSGNGASIEILSRDHNSSDRALSVELGPGRVNFHPVSQYLALSQGRYTLSGAFKGNLRGTRGLRWKVSCLDSPHSLSASEMFLDNGSRWSRFTVQIDIPQTCKAQSLSLVLDARTASETIISGRAWFDELKIKKD